MNRSIILKVAVYNIPYHIDKLYSYYVSEEDINNIELGKRVIIPFGNGNKKKQGVIFDILKNDTNIDDNLKYIIEIIDDNSFISIELLSIISFLVRTTFCTYHQAIQCILPNGINYKLENSYILNKDMNFSNYDQSELLIFEFLNIKRKESEILNFINNNGYKKDRFIELINDKIILKDVNIIRNIKDLNIKMIKLNSNFTEDKHKYKITPKNKLVINFIDEVKICSVKEACYFTGCSQTVIKNLEQKKIIDIFEKPEYRRPKDVYKIDFYKDIILNLKQEEIYNSLLENYREDKPIVSLVHGVTGSGKTFVFLKIIKEIINQKQTVLYLVPEISLTSQIISFLKVHFGDILAIIHSGLTMSERLDEFKRINEKKASIVVGTRSSIFAPLENIGLIIIDEEHEKTYKSEHSPRYDAREIAKFRAVKNNCLLILASATPSIESYYNAIENKYNLYSMDRRYNQNPLSTVKFVDLTNFTDKEYMITKNLYIEIEKNIQDKKQSIILINKRGYNNILLCYNCGLGFVCKNCTVNMIYHKTNNRIVCHYCSYSIPYTNICSSCGMDKVEFLGYGTQKIEDEIRSLLPNSRILRIDTDSIDSRIDFENKINRINNNEYDIIIGTQMIAKGFNFLNVTLVGILGIDNLLYTADYRANENVFSLVTQVIGRSGRGLEKGRAVIQTFLKDNLILNLAGKQDYKEFYQKEIEFRKELLYPPFVNICTIYISGKQEKILLECIEYIESMINYNYNFISNNTLFSYMGFSKNYPYMVNNNFTFKFIIKCKMHKIIRKFINMAIIYVYKEYRFKNIKISVDID
ncbi:MAG: primosomal protein N' [Oscillospiraceae bacterium]|nr:primosomal protein N' [Oscillospiraceae bacterium]